MPPATTVDSSLTLGVVLAVVAVIAIAILVRATVGFGDALLAMPVLAVLVGVRTAAPLVTALSLTVAALILGRAGRAAAMREAGALLLGALPGVPVGILLLRVLPEAVLAAALGATVCAYGVWRVRGHRRADAHAVAATPPTQSGPHRLAPVAGFAAGAFGSATGAGGPPVVMYGAHRRWAPSTFRATLQVYFLCAGALALVGYVASGLWTATSTRLYLVSLPAVLIAVVAGSWLARHVADDRFARLVAVALVALGGSLLVTSVWGM